MRAAGSVYSYPQAHRDKRGGYKAALAAQPHVGMARTTSRIGIIYGRNARGSFAVSGSIWASKFFNLVIVPFA